MYSENMLLHVLGIKAQMGKKKPCVRCRGGTREVAANVPRVSPANSIWFQVLRTTVSGGVPGTTHHEQGQIPKAFVHAFRIL